MKPVVIAGILLIVLGIISLSYNRIIYTKQENSPRLPSGKNRFRCLLFWAVWRSLRALGCRK